MSKFLRKGDLIELCKGHEVYARVPEKHVYSNRKGSNTLTETNITIGGRFSDFAGTYAVVRTAMDGGGTGHGPGDVYPDGHHVYCRRVSDGKRVGFYQSGCFNAMIEDIEPIGRRQTGNRRPKTPVPAVEVDF